MIKDFQQIVNFSFESPSTQLFYLDHFSKCNNYLIKRGMEPIDWNLGEPNQGGNTTENNGTSMLTEEVADDYLSSGSPRKDE